MVGAGILGLAHAYHLARRGLKVVVFERHSRAQGASVRNFGMIWPIGQPSGPMYQMAKRSRDLWLEVLAASGLWHARSGSLHVAYHDDEEQVLREFAAEASREGRRCEMWTPAQVTARYPAIREADLRAGLWSPGEVGVDPRQVIASLPDWLIADFRRDLRIRDHRSALRLASSYHDQWRLAGPAAGHLHWGGLPRSGSGSLRARRPGRLQIADDAVTGVWAIGFAWGPNWLRGLTLRHYPSFAACPTLPELDRRLDAELPDHVRFGIHVLVAQNADGELVIGDSHEYGDAIEPFDKPQIDDLILEYLQTFLVGPGTDHRRSLAWGVCQAPHQPLCHRPANTGIAGGDRCRWGWDDLVVRTGGTDVKDWLGERP